MRLSSFLVKKFKSIVDTGECRLSDTDNILVLAGQNEAGKSAVIEALNFFGNGSSEDFERLQRRQDEDPEVECGFYLEDDDINAIFTATDREDFKRYLKENRDVRFKRVKSDDGSFDSVYFTETALEQLEPFFRVEQISVPEPESATQSAVDMQAPAEQPQTNLPKITTIEQLKDFIYQRTRDFIFFDTFSNLLPGIVTVAEIKKHPAVLDFQKLFSANFENIVKRDPRAIGREEVRLNRRASDDLNTYWTQKIEDRGKYNFTVKIVPQTPAESASQIEFKIDRDDGDPLFMEQKSKGFRWFSAFNLRLRALGIDKDKIKKLIILIDEPGQGLHEKAQRDVKKVIEELGEKGAQIIYTTHHPNLIGTEEREFARIRIVSNKKNIGTKVETVAQFASRADVGATDTLSPLVTAMGIHSVASLIDPNRKNVLVEGITDHYYFSAFRKLLNKSEQLFFIPACGVNNVPNLASVLIGWGFNFKAVLDQDRDSGRKAYNLLKKEFYENSDSLAHEHIFKLPNCNGVEDLLTPQDLYEFVLNQPVPANIPDINSKLVSDKKEPFARMFLEKVENDQVTLSPASIQKIKEVFDWLYSKFGIT